MKVGDKRLAKALSDKWHLDDTQWLKWMMSPVFPETLHYVLKNALTLMQQSAFRLRYENELSYREIGDRLSVTLSQARQLITEALRILSQEEWKEMLLSGRTDSYRMPKSSLALLGLSARVYNVLARAGYRTVEEVIFLSAEEIRSVPGVGKKAREELFTKLVANGYDVKWKVRNRKQ